MANTLTISIISILVGYFFGAWIAILLALIVGFFYKPYALPIVAAFFDGLNFAWPWLTLIMLLVALAIMRLTQDWYRQPRRYSSHLKF